MDRNDFSALTEYPTFVRDLIREASEAGLFEPGIVSSRNGRRGVAINVDVYGYDEAAGLAVVQVRQCEFRRERYNRVRKNYFLLGRTEQGAVFGHPCESPARSRRAMASDDPAAAVRFVLSRIWDCRETDLDEIVRQGDIAFVPADLPETAELLVGSDGPITTVVIRSTHIITAEQIYVMHGRLQPEHNTYYTMRKARAVHTKRQHGTVHTNGCYRVQAGIRASVWAFTAPRLGD